MNKIEFITLKNNKGLEVILSNFGASFYRIIYKGEDMILTPRDESVFLDNSRYYGLTIGRIAGRVKNGLLVIDDKTYKLEQNEGTNSLHGGINTIAHKYWDYEVNKGEEYSSVLFVINTANGEAGYNGNCLYKVEYRLYHENNIIELRYDALCDQTTLFNMTNHVYFNLGYQKNILNHELEIKADEVSTFDDDFAISGYKSVSGTIFDFNNMKRIGKDIDDKELHIEHLNGYDHRFHLVDPINKPIVLRNDKYQLEIYTDFDGVHVYTSGFTDHDILINGRKEALYNGVALECHNIYPERVEKNTHYQHFIKYILK